MSQKRPLPASNDSHLIETLLTDSPSSDGRRKRSRGSAVTSPESSSTNGVTMPNHILNEDEHSGKFLQK